MSCAVNAEQIDVNAHLNLPAELQNWPIELLKIVEPHEAERLCSLSWDSIRRNHPDKVVHLSKRRVGMRIGHALMLAGDG